MLPVLTPEEMGAADRATIAAGTPEAVLMDRAGHAVAWAVRTRLRGLYGERAVVVCGKGNNGGDGVIAARVLAAVGRACRRVPPRIGCTCAPSSCVRSRVPTSSSTRCTAPGSAASSKATRTRLPALVRASADRSSPSTSRRVCTDSPARCTGTAVRADETVCFAALQAGAAVRTGSFARRARARRRHRDSASTIVAGARGSPRPPTSRSGSPPRDADAHKWRAGCYVVGGSGGMTGAPSLVSHAAMRTGAGIVWCGVPGADAAARSRGARSSPRRCRRRPTASLSDGAAKDVLDRPRAVPRARHRPRARPVADHRARPCVGSLAAAPRPGSGRRRRPPRGGRRPCVAPDPLGAHDPHPTRRRVRRRCGAARRVPTGSRPPAPSPPIRAPSCSSRDRARSSPRPTGVAWICPTGGPWLATAGTGDVLTGVIAGAAGPGRRCRSTRRPPGPSCTDRPPTWPGILGSWPGISWRRSRPCCPTSPGSRALVSEVPALSRPAWVAVDLDAVRANVRALAAAAAPAALLATVKADAYGHGAVPVARAAVEAGAGLARGGVRRGGHRAARGGHRRADRAALGAAAGRGGRGGRAPAHAVRVHGDRDRRAGQGGGRRRRAAASGAPQGRHRDAPRRLRGARRGRARRDDRGTRRAASSKGMATHLAVADEADSEYTDAQLDAFDDVVAAVTDRVGRPADRPRRELGRVCSRTRAPGTTSCAPGIALYGIAPRRRARRPPSRLRPALSLHARVSYVKDLARGRTRARTASGTTLRRVRRASRRCRSVTPTACRGRSARRGRGARAAARGARSRER